MKLLLIIVLAIVAAIWSLQYEFITALFLQLLYFAGSTSWWGGSWFRPVEMFNVLAILLILIKRGKIVVGKVGCFLFFFVTLFYISAYSAIVSKAIAIDYTFNILKLVITYIVFYNMALYNNKFPKYFLLMNTICLVYISKSIIYTYIATGGNRVDIGVAQGGGANYIAMLYAMALPFVLFGMQMKYSYKTRMIYAFTSILFFICIVFTGSRAGFLSIIFICLIYASQLSFKRRVYFISISLGVCLIASIYLSEQYSNRMQTIVDYSEESSASNRLEEWKTAIEIFSDNVFNGIGGNNFYLVSQNYTGIYSNEVFEGRKVGLVAHNTYLQMMAEAGVLSIIIYMTCVYTSLKSLYVAFSQAVSETNKQILFSLFTGIFVFSICAIFGSLLLRDVMYWYLAVSQGLVSRKDTLNI